MQCRRCMPHLNSQQHGQHNPFHINQAELINGEAGLAN